MDYYFFDKRKDPNHTFWSIPFENPKYAVLEIAEKFRFHDISFFTQLFLKYNAPLIVFCSDINKKKRIDEVEKYLSMKSLIPNGFLVFKDFSESSIKLFIEASEHLGKWEEWSIGFLENSDSDELLNKCKIDEYPIGALVKSGLLNFITIRNYDNVRITFFIFQEFIIDEYRDFIVKGLSLGSEKPYQLG